MQPIKRFRFLSFMAAAGWVVAFLIACIAPAMAHGRHNSVQHPPIIVYIGPVTKTHDRGR